MDYSDQIESRTQTNKNKIRCSRCDSLILQPNASTFKEYSKPIPIPSINQKKDLVKTNLEYLDSTKFWLVNDMYTFENIGFTNLVENKKYLICSDCEIGKKKRFLIYQVNSFFNFLFK